MLAAGSMLVTDPSSPRWGSLSVSGKGDGLWWVLWSESKPSLGSNAIFSRSSLLVHDASDREVSLGYTTQTPAVESAGPNVTSTEVTKPQ